MKLFDLNPHKCRVCGKTFEATQEYVYKRGRPKHYAWFCSYHCMTEYDKRGVKKKCKGSTLSCG